MSASTELSVSPPPDRAWLARLGAAGAAAWLGLGFVGALVGAPASFVAGLLAAPVVASVHVVVLTLPGLLVAQAALGLVATPTETLSALAGGLRQGAALLLAVLPLVLFFGVSLGTPWHVAWLSYGAGELALLVTLGQTVRTLLGAEPDLAAYAVYGTFGAVAATVGTMAGSDALRLLGGAA